VLATDCVNETMGSKQQWRCGVGSRGEGPLFPVRVRLGAEAKLVPPTASTHPPWQLSVKLLTPNNNTGQQ